MLRSEFEEMISKGVVITDGAMGSELRKRGMPVGVCTEFWAYEHPEVVEQLQREYIDAGSDIIYAPTFSCNRLGLRMHGLEDKLQEINAGLVAISKRAAAGRALVAGDFTTVGRPLEPVGTLTYEELFEVYAEQVSVVAEAGADLLIVETMLGLDETACFVEAAQSVCDLPIMCTLTVEADGHLMFGGDVVEAVETLQALGACAVGLNCSVGPDQLESVVAAMKAVAEVPVIAKPNAGIPMMDDKGQAHYSMGPEDFARHMLKLRDAGAQVMGGCCGTNPEYIRALKKTLG